MADWTKLEWRRWAKETWAQLELAILSEKVTRQLAHSPLFSDAKHILTYLAFGNELDLAALLDKYPNQQFYATRTHEDHTLTVHKLTGELTGNFERHPYGFFAAQGGQSGS